MTASIASDAGPYGFSLLLRRMTPLASNPRGRSRRSRPLPRLEPASLEQRDEGCATGDGGAEEGTAGVAHWGSGVGMIQDTVRRAGRECVLEGADARRGPVPRDIQRRPQPQPQQPPSDPTTSQPARSCPLALVLDSAAADATAPRRIPERRRSLGHLRRAQLGPESRCWCDVPTRADLTSTPPPRARWRQHGGTRCQSPRPQARPSSGSEITDPKTQPSGGGARRHGRTAEIRTRNIPAPTAMRNPRQRAELTQATRRHRHIEQRRRRRAWRVLRRTDLHTRASVTFETHDEVGNRHRVDRAGSSTIATRGIWRARPRRGGRYAAPRHARLTLPHRKFPVAMTIAPTTGW
jgi:hypothetical protein